jgi:membrane protein implicated in regulation of membrane protease activity
MISLVMRVGTSRGTLSNWLKTRSLFFMPKRRDDLSHTLRYAATQIPGLGAVAGLLYLAVRVEWIGPWSAALVFSLFAGFDIIVYLHSRHLFGAPPHNGAEALHGRAAVALTSLDPDGFAQLGSERWRARLALGGRVEAGRPVLVDEVQGLVLIVRPGPEST